MHTQPADEEALCSVVIIVRNGERFLNQAIDSVIAQTYSRYEIIVVDGQSTDNTEKIARSYPQVRYVRQTGLGVADAYNTGIDAARGEFIAFLSHDDLWAPSKLAAQVGFLLEHPEIQCCVSALKMFLQPGCGVPPGFKAELLEGEHVVRLMENLVARRSVFDFAGKLDPAFSPADDTEWYARATDKGVSMAVVSEVLLYKRIHDKNTSLADAERNNRLLLWILRESIRRKHSLRSSGQESKQCS